MLKKILIGFGLFLLLILLFRICGTESTDKVPTNGNKTVIVEITEIDKTHYFKAYLRDHLGKKSEIQAYGVEKIKNTTTNSEITFDRTGQMYICHTDTGLTALRFIFKDADLKEYVWTGELHLFGRVPSNKAKCPIVLSWDDFKITGPNNCAYELTLTKTGREKNISLKNIKVSITGLSGPYTEKLSWKSENIPDRKFDIFVVHNDHDTLKGYFQNGGTYPTCVEWTPAKANELANRIYSLANAYGSNPSNRNNSRPFRELIFSFPNQVLILDGRELDMADLENIMSTEYENTGRKYRLKSLPMFNNDGSTVTVHFISI
jgi:hypothetical protein